MVLPGFTEVGDEDDVAVARPTASDAAEQLHPHGVDPAPYRLVCEELCPPRPPVAAFVPVSTRFPQDPDS